VTFVWARKVSKSSRVGLQAAQTARQSILNRRLWRHANVIRAGVLKSYYRYCTRAIGVGVFRRARPCATYSVGMGWCLSNAVGDTSVIPAAHQSDPCTQRSVECRL